MPGISNFQSGNIHFALCLVLLFLSTTSFGQSLEKPESKDTLQNPNSFSLLPSGLLLYGNLSAADAFRLAEKRNFMNTEKPQKELFKKWKESEQLKDATSYRNRYGMPEATVVNDEIPIMLRKPDFPANAPAYGENVVPALIFGSIGYIGYLIEEKKKK
jgi:hypothetical protein